MKNEFLNYLEENFYVDFDRDDSYKLDENGNITELYLWGHNHTYGVSHDPRYISDIALLLPLCNSLRVLHINGWTVADMSPLKYFVHLRELSLAGNNRIGKISGIEDLTRLEFLDLSYNRIEKIEGLGKLTDLKFLNLSVNILGTSGGIKKIEGLEAQTNLEALYLAENEIEHVENISHLSKLKRLTLHRNKIKVLEPVPALCGLTRLTIGGELVGFPDLHPYPLLEELGITGRFTEIPDLGFLEHLHTAVICGKKEIQNPEQLLKHKQLQNIEIEYKVRKGSVSPFFWTSDK